ncbi:hypothetical protein BATDEDRAFT_21501 [Batrachochytrium dendrobatidis JAM81]|uniref:C2H2-type domain-containing protein n=1 Tax=Batrachochytrium dendrobatidis (strain JAM81 / FGSC 10211) TaxID=684364 RepID=F4NTH1_BATDJ|nr:uncharacterized protein BATDEDRAFT_21501 [Batrachochytrium dendrobatidis JAM81]EGF83110.1 hypothetical protein BATDEDRAFT_21501 [Batrachochytrium dendrobatidis JAM81]|eukprot:XP_006675303.1 hypothetical protein BATDEDRAFT_21501 [Batrachochytrium dendrobatidis JAM81]
MPLTTPTPLHFSPPHTENNTLAKDPYLQSLDIVSLINLTDIKIMANLENVPAGSYIPCYTLRFHAHPHTYNLHDLTLSASAVASSIDMLLLLASTATSLDVDSTTCDTTKTFQADPITSSVTLGSTYLSHCGGPWTEVRGPAFTVASSNSNVVVRIETSPYECSESDKSSAILRSGLDIGCVCLMPTSPSQKPLYVQPLVNFSSPSQTVKSEHHSESNVNAFDSPLSNYIPQKSFNSIFNLLNADEESSRLEKIYTAHEPSVQHGTSSNSSSTDHISTDRDFVRKVSDPSLFESPLMQKKHYNDGYDDEHENASTTSTDPDYTGKIYECPEPTCDRTFSRPFNLKAHVIIHNPVRNRAHKCTSCELSFCRSQDLIRHMQIHNRTITYSCPGCKKVFSRKDALRRHQRSSRNCPLFNDQPARRSRKGHEDAIPNTVHSTPKPSPSFKQHNSPSTTASSDDVLHALPTPREPLKIVQYVPGYTRSYARRFKTGSNDSGIGSMHCSHSPASPPSTDCESSSTSRIGVSSSSTTVCYEPNLQMSYASEMTA